MKVRLASAAPAALSLILACCGAAAQVVAANGIAIEAAWSRPVGAGTAVGAGYLKIANGGSEADVLLGGSSEVAERVEVHETTTGEDGVARMRRLDGLEIKPGATVELKPLGTHVMLIGLKRPLNEGDTFKVKLDFQKAGAVDVDFTVKAAGALGEEGPAKHVH